MGVVGSSAPVPRTLEIQNLLEASELLLGDEAVHDLHSNDFIRGPIDLRPVALAPVRFRALLQQVMDHAASCKPATLRRSRCAV